MSRSRLSSAFYVFLVFLSGGVVGAFSHRLYIMNSVKAESGPPSPAEWRKRYLEEMSARVSLTAEQLTKLNAILDETRERHRELQARHRPEYRAIQDEQVNQIRGLLTESQRPLYEKLREEREQRRREWEKNRRF
ncbi:MAG: hypothetical protein HY013_13715 [Candidatus Solibacter usitatus]|nr:hypothetical protein [Candidatus Solibacter usitatus]